MGPRKLTGSHDGFITWDFIHLYCMDRRIFNKGNCVRSRNTKFFTSYCQILILSIQGPSNHI